MPTSAGEPTVFAQAMKLAIITAAASRGVPPDEICGEIGASPEQVADPVERVPHALVVRAWARLEQGCDDFGLRAARIASVPRESLIDYVLASARDLREGLTALVRFQRWMHEAARHDLRIEAGRAILRLGLAPPYTLPLALWDFLAATAVIRARHLAAIEPLEVRLDRPPHDAEGMARAVLGPVIRHHAGAVEIHWAEAALDRPIAGADAGLHRILSRQLEVALGLAPQPRAWPETSGGDVARALRPALIAAILRGDVSLDAVAKRLSTSGRSLQRRLTERGTTFQAELDGARESLALRLLSEPSASVKAVAHTIGFAHVAAFSRAFRRWTGEAPAARLRGRPSARG